MRILFAVRQPNLFQKFAFPSFEVNEDYRLIDEVLEGAVAEWQVKSLFPIKFSKNGKKWILLNLNKFVHLATVP